LLGVQHACKADAAARAARSFGYNLLTILSGEDRLPTL
jgi:hypothetical protein